MGQLVPSSNGCWTTGGIRKPAPIDYWRMSDRFQRRTADRFGGESAEVERVVFLAVSGGYSLSLSVTSRAYGR